MKKYIVLLVLGLSAFSIYPSAFTVTAYCPCRICCGPNATGITASGKPARAGVTVAGPSALPFGTRLRIAGVGERVVQDRLAKRFDSRIDVFVATHQEAKQFGIKQLDVVKGNHDH